MSDFEAFGCSLVVAAMLVIGTAFAVHEPRDMVVKPVVLKHIAKKQVAKSTANMTDREKLQYLYGGV